MNNTFINQHKLQLQQFAEANDIVFLAVFGSQARGDAQQDSDVDMLADFAQPVGLLHRARTRMKLEQLLHKKVNLLSRKYLRPSFKKYIQDDVIQIV